MKTITWITTIALFLALAPAGRACTNYLITGEVATRTVVRFEQLCPTCVPGRMRLKPVIESFNILPPE